MTDTTEKQELILRVAEEAVRGRLNWRQEYLENLTEHGVTFNEVEAEIARLKDGPAGVRSGRGPYLTAEQLFTVPGMFLTICAVAIVYFSGDILFKTMTIPSWSTTTGTVTQASDWSGGVVRPAVGFGRTRGIVFLGCALLGAKVKYVYNVGGKGYESTTVHLGQTEFSDLEKYPENSSVRVMYNPQNPGESILENRIAIPWSALLIVGLFVLFIARISGSGWNNDLR